MVFRTNIYNRDNFNFDSTKIFRGIPADLTQYLIKELDMQPEQGMYELYKRLNGKMSASTLLKGLPKSRTDTLSLSAVPIRHTIHFLTGISKAGKQVVITDANNNDDFSDDQKTLFDTAETKKPYFGETALLNIPVRYQQSVNGKAYDRILNMKVSPFKTAFSYRTPVEQSLYLVVHINEFKTGNWVVNGDTLVFNCTSDAPPFSFDTLNTSIVMQNRGKAGKYVLGDTVVLAKKKYVFSAISVFGDSLYLRESGSGELTYGIDAGKKAFSFAATDLHGNTFSLETQVGKYVLLDFWGSWCKPCIASIPELKNTAERFRNKLRVVSIAYDDPQNYGIVKKIIADNKMNWTHLLEDIKDPNRQGIINRYKVSVFPTQILIGPDGIIIERIEGTGKSDIINARLSDPGK
jgi:thiol-disulfide isomerase/thioredoxin